MWSAVHYWPIETNLTTINVHACTVYDMTFHEYHCHDSRDTDQKVLRSSWKEPFITDHSQQTQNTKAHAHTVCDMTFHENRCRDRRDTDQRYFDRHRKCPLLLKIRNQTQNTKAHACSMSETKLQENRPCERLFTDQNVLYSPSKVPFVTDQSQPNVQQLTSMRVECVMWSFMKIAGMTVRIQTKRYLVPHVKLLSLLTGRNQSHISCACVYSVQYEFSGKSLF
jgi:hypothetical protein